MNWPALLKSGSGYSSSNRCSAHLLMCAGNGCELSCSVSIQVAFAKCTACSSGTCTAISACNSGHHNFNGVVTDGCEFAASSVVVVGATCTAASSTTTCTAITACNSGWYDYDGIVSNGCEGTTCLNTDGKSFLVLLF